MSWPNGVTLVTGSVGDSIGASGESADRLYVAVAPVFGEGVHRLLHAESGTVWDDRAVVVSGSPTLFVQVPVVDQTGFVDGAGNEVADWYYVVEVIARSGRRSSRWSYDWQPVAADGANVDLDTLGDGVIVTDPTVIYAPARDALAAREAAAEAAASAATAEGAVTAVAGYASAAAGSATGAALSEQTSADYVTDALAAAADAESSANDADDSATLAAGSAADAAGSASASAGSATDAAGYASATAGSAGDTLMASRIASLTSSTRAALNAAYLRRTGVKYVDLFTGFFGGASGIYITGQASAGTTLTAAAAIGDTVLAVTDATGIVAGMLLVANAGTSTQQRMVVASVASNNVTLTAALTAGIAAGAAVDPVWGNFNHLSYPSTSPKPGYLALARYIANAQDRSGNYLITGTTPKVTFLFNSWGAQAPGLYTAAVQARIPAATVVESGISGQRTDQLLARFDTDVPTDSTHVVLFEHVNDIGQGVPERTMATNWEALVAKVIAIGAVPIVVGPPPLQANLQASISWARDFAAMIGDGTAFPRVPLSAVLGSSPIPTVLTGASHGTPNGPHALGIGEGALGSGKYTGTGTTAVGWLAGTALVNGNDHTIMGAQAGQALTGGVGNTLIGRSAGQALLTASGDTFVGHQAGFDTTGGNNTFLGYQAGRAPNNDTANTTTTAVGQTLLGANTGLGTPTQRNYITCIGFKTSSDTAGGVAIGVDSTGAGAHATALDQIALGTSLHSVVVGKDLTVTGGKTTLQATSAAGASVRITPGSAAPTTPLTGDVWVTTSGLFVNVNGTVNRMAGILVSGTATLVAGDASVTNPLVTSTTKVRLSRQAAGGTPGNLGITRSVGSGFHITSTSNTDTSEVYYEVVSW